MSLIITTPDQADAYTHSYTKYLTITAYTGAKSEGGAYTATGRKLRIGDCACARNIPLHTRIYIPQLRKTFTCVDRYSKRLSPRIDVYMPSRKAARTFGKRKLSVKVYR